MSRFAALPEPPYYACLFSSQRNEVDGGYAALAEQMAQRALAHFDCLGVESARDASGFGITVSYWKSADDIRAWQEDAKHLAAQTLGKDTFYTHYAVRISKVERAYDKTG